MKQPSPQKPPPKLTPGNVKIEVNGLAIETPRAIVTGAFVKALAGLPFEHQLFMERAGDDSPVPDADVVALRNRQRFYTLPPAMFG